MTYSGSHTWKNRDCRSQIPANKPLCAAELEGTWDITWSKESPSCTYDTVPFPIRDMLLVSITVNDKESNKNFWYTHNGAFYVLSLTFMITLQVRDDSSQFTTESAWFRAVKWLNVIPMARNGTPDVQTDRPEAALSF